MRDSQREAATVQDDQAGDEHGAGPVAADGPPRAPSSAPTTRATVTGIVTSTLAIVVAKKARARSWGLKMVSQRIEQGEHPEPADRYPHQPGVRPVEQGFGDRLAGKGRAIRAPALVAPEEHANQLESTAPGSSSSL